MYITDRDLVKFHSPTAYKEANDMLKFYRARAKCEEAWKHRDDELEAMLSQGYIDHSHLAHLERIAVRWERAADKLYAQANECDCKPDASEVCASCRAYLNSNAGEELAFEEV